MSDDLQGARSTGGASDDAVAAVAAPDTTNRFAVGASLSGDVMVLGTVVLQQELAAGGLSEDDALNLAAYLVVSCPSPDAPNKFVRLFDALRRS